MELHLIDNKTAPKSQRFRWQLKGRNGKIVAASSEGFSTAEGCEENVIRTVEGLYNNVTVMRDRHWKQCAFAGLLGFALGLLVCGLA